MRTYRIVESTFFEVFFFSLSLSINPKTYKGIKLLEHAFKLYEKILDERLREVVDIDMMHRRFMPGRGTVDAVCVLRRLIEKFRAKNKKLFFCIC